jgi:hypothetical protein
MENAIIGCSFLMEIMLKSDITCSMWSLTSSVKFLNEMSKKIMQFSSLELIEIVQVCEKTLWMLPRYCFDLKIPSWSGWWFNYMCSAPGVVFGQEILPTIESWRQQCAALRNIVACMLSINVFTCCLWCPAYWMAATPVDSGRLFSHTQNLSDQA